jgi:hypothetical protein
MHGQGGDDASEPDNTANEPMFYIHGDSNP